MPRRKKARPEVQALEAIILLSGVGGAMPIVAAQVSAKATTQEALNGTVQGVVVGLIAGLGIFIATNWLIIKGGPVVGPHLALLGQFFIGYRVTFVGSLIGFAYGFVLGFCVGYGVARAYNWLADLRQAMSKVEDVRRSGPNTTTN